MRVTGKLLLLALLLTLSACGRRGGADQLPVYGSVAFEGKPLQEGVITFLQVNAGEAASANIREGEFRLASRQGLSAGKYRVEIESNQKTGKSVPGVGPGGKIDEIKQVIPARYNKKSELALDLTSKTSLPLEYKLLAK